MYLPRKNDKTSAGKKPEIGDLTYVAAPDSIAHIAWVFSVHFNLKYVKLTMKSYLASVWAGMDDEGNEHVPQIIVNLFET